VPILEWLGDAIIKPLLGPGFARTGKKAGFAPSSAGSDFLGALGLNDARLLPYDAAGDGALKRLETRQSIHGEKRDGQRSNNLDIHYETEGEARRSSSFMAWAPLQAFGMAQRKT